MKYGFAVIAAVSTVLGCAGSASAMDACSTAVAGSTKFTLNAPATVSNAPSSVSAVDLLCTFTFNVLNGSGGSKQCYEFTGGGVLTNHSLNTNYQISFLYDSKNYSLAHYDCHLRESLPTTTQEIEPSETSPGDIVHQSGPNGGAMHGGVQ